MMPKAQTFALPHRIVDHALMPSQDTAIQMHDVSGLRRVGPVFAHNGGIISVRYKADILAVRLIRHHKAHLPRHRPRLALRQAAQRKAQESKLLARCRKQEVTLVATRIGRTVQLRPRRSHQPLHIVARDERLRPQLPRGPQKVREFDPLIAAHTRDWRLPARIS